MGKNNQWPRAELAKAIQFSALPITVVMTVLWANQYFSISSSAWWQPLLLSLAGGAALFFYCLRVERIARQCKRQLELEVAAKTEELNRAQSAIVFGLANLSERRDTDTGDHLNRIRKYVTILARDLSSKYPQFDEANIQKLGLASSLHDIGKVGIPDLILLKPGLLSDGERKIMECHTLIGGECLEAIQSRLGENEFLEMAREIALSHHERWDGSGYPHQLTRQAIPLVARIVALADVYDALTSKRPYKQARSHAASRQILFEGRGTQFDPDIIDAFMRHEAEFEAISIAQKNVSDEDSIPGLQRLNDAVAALQSSTTNLIGVAASRMTVNSNPMV